MLKLGVFGILLILIYYLRRKKNQEQLPTDVIASEVDVWTITNFNSYMFGDKNNDHTILMHI
jgi:hypothetical protein